MPAPGPSPVKSAVLNPAEVNSSQCSVGNFFDLPHPRPSLPLNPFRSLRTTRAPSAGQPMVRVTPQGPGLPAPAGDARPRALTGVRLWPTDNMGRPRVSRLCAHCGFWASRRCRRCRWSPGRIRLLPPRLPGLSRDRVLARLHRLATGSGSRDRGKC